MVHDVDKTAIGAPIYIATRGLAPNPFPDVTDFTAISSFGTVQSALAADLSLIDPRINSAHYGHADFLTADDSLADAASPGVPGASLVGGTLLDWMLARTTGTLYTLSAEALGIRATR